VAQEVSVFFYTQVRINNDSIITLLGGVTVGIKTSEQELAYEQ
jgi:hypothetical protein